MLQAVAIHFTDGYTLDGLKCFMVNYVLENHPKSDGTLNLDYTTVGNIKIDEAYLRYIIVADDSSTPAEIASGILSGALTDNYWDMIDTRSLFE